MNVKDPQWLNLRQERFNLGSNTNMNPQLQSPRVKVELYSDLSLSVTDFPHIAFANCDQQVQQSKKKKTCTALERISSLTMLPFISGMISPHKVACTRSLMHTHTPTHRRYSVSFCSGDVDHLITKALAVPTLCRFCRDVSEVISLSTVWHYRTKLLQLNLVANPEKCDFCTSPRKVPKISIFSRLIFLTCSAQYNINAACVQATTGEQTIDSPEKFVEVSMLHVLEHHDERVSVYTHSIELNNVVVLEVGQQLRLPLEILSCWQVGIF